MARYIWVVGPPRSGTTWIGKMLANQLNAQYIHEPFHPGNQPEWSPVSYQYHTSLHNEELISYLNQRINNKGKYLTWRLSINSIRDRAYHLKQYIISRFKKIVVVKDPHLSLCVVDLLKNYPFSKVVWVTRNYEDHKKSLLNKGWSYSINDLKKQLDHMDFVKGDLREKLERADNLRMEEKIELGHTVFEEYLGMLESNNNSAFIICRYEDMLEDDKSYMAQLLWKLGISSN